MLKQMEEITNTFTVIQDTWDEEDDVELLEYVSNNKITTKYLSDSEILNIRLSDINVLFCDTHIIQKMINPKYIPNCYPDIFNSLYNRNIQKIQFKDLYDIKKPYFVKPYENDKSFEAHKIRNNRDYKFLLEDLQQHNILDNDYLYISNIVEFINEFRLFIGKNKIYGGVESTDILINSEKSVSINPPEDFLNKVLQNNTFEFCVIDIGIIDFDGIYKWSIVEVNPPFALSSYDWPIENYYNYCKDAFNYIKN